MRRWKLLKDVLVTNEFIKAGTIIDEVTRNTVTGEKRCGFLLSPSRIEHMYLSIDFIEHYPDWFEEIKPKRVWVIEVPWENLDRDVSHVQIETYRLGPVFRRQMIARIEER